MGKIGYKPVILSDTVEVNFQNNVLKMKGKLGELCLNIPPSISLDIHKEQILVQGENEALRGTIRQLLYSIHVGVSTGYKYSLELRGVGYKVNVSGQKLEFSLGFSHPIFYELPENVKAEVNNNIFTLQGIDKQLLGNIVAEIRKLRPPEPYKGKGICFVNEKVRRKVGKTAKK